MMSTWRQIRFATHLNCVRIAAVQQLKGFWSPAVQPIRDECAIMRGACALVRHEPIRVWPILGNVAFLLSFKIGLCDTQVKWSSLLDRTVNPVSRIKSEGWLDDRWHQCVPTPTSQLCLPLCSSVRVSECVHFRWHACACVPVCARLHT